MHYTTRTATRGATNAVIGNISRDEFKRANENGAETVSSVEAAGDELSDGDRSLFLEVAKGGTMQLELSRLAIDRARAREVLAMAAAEVEEQIGLGDKLREIADAKGFTLPGGPDAETRAVTEQLRRLSGDDFDRVYIMASGIVGHETLDEVMSRVEAEAEDNDLADLATTAHPLVRTHLEAARAIIENI